MIEFIDKVVANIKNKGYARAYSTLKKHIIAFSGANTRFENINKKYCMEFVEYLTEQEIKEVYNVETKFTDCKNAFIFSCFTGLRYIDLTNLKFVDVKENSIYIVQTKTKEPLQIALNETAMRIIEEQWISQKNKQHVFNITSYDSWADSIKSILKKTNITKTLPRCVFQMT
jgi:integrase